MTYKKILIKSGYYGNLVKYLKGEIFSKGIHFLSIPLFAAILTPSEYGLVSIFILFQPFLTILVSLNSPGYIRHNILKGESSLEIYLGNIIPFLFACCLIFALISFAFLDELVTLLDLDKYSTIILVIFAISQVFFQLYSFYLLGKGNSSRYSKLIFFYAFLQFSLSIIFIEIFSVNNFYGRIVGIVAASLICCSYAIVKLLKYAKFKFNWQSIKNNLAFSIPLIPHALSGMLLSQIDRYIINDLEGNEAAGLYSFAYNIGMVTMIFIIAFNNSWMPNFYKLLKEKDYPLINSKIVIMSKKVVILVFLLSLSLPFLISFFTPEDYHNSLSIIPLIGLSSLFFFYYTLYANYLFYQGLTLYISISTLLSGILNIVLNYMFIPIFGYKVAAITTVFCYILLFLVIFFLARMKTTVQLIPLKNLILLKNNG